MANTRRGCYTPPFEVNDVPEQTTQALQKTYDLLNEQRCWQMTHYLDKHKAHYPDITNSWIRIIGDELVARKRNAGDGGNDAPKD